MVSSCRNACFDSSRQEERPDERRTNSAPRIPAIRAAFFKDRVGRRERRRSSLHTEYQIPVVFIIQFLSVAGLIQKSATRETPNELNEVVNSSTQQSSDFEREEQK